MTIMVNIAKAKATLSELVARAEAGEEVVLSRNGEPIVIRGAVKPISTLARPLPTADLVTGEGVDKAHYERSDISVVPAAGVIGEAMVILTLTAAVLEKFGGDSLAEVEDNLARYLERIARLPVAIAEADPGGEGAAPPGSAAGRGSRAAGSGAAGSGAAGSGGDD